MATLTTSVSCYSVDLDTTMHDVCSNIDNYLSYYTKTDYTVKALNPANITSLELPAISLYYKHNYCKITAYFDGFTLDYYYFMTPSVSTLTSVNYALKLDVFSTYLKNNSNTLKVLRGKHIQGNEYNNAIPVQLTANFGDISSVVVNTINNVNKCAYVVTIKYHNEDEANKAKYGVVFPTDNEFTELDAIVNDFLTFKTSLQRFEIQSLGDNMFVCTEITGVYVIPYDLCSNFTNVEASPLYSNVGARTQTGYAFVSNIDRNGGFTFTASDTTKRYYFGNGRQQEQIIVKNETQTLNPHFTVLPFFGTVNFCVFYNGKTIDFTDALKIGSISLTYDDYSLNEKISDALSALASTVQLGASVATAATPIISSSLAVSGASGIITTFEKAKNRESAKVSVNIDNAIAMFYVSAGDGSISKVYGFARVTETFKNDTVLRQIQGDYGNEFEYDLYNTNIITTSYNKTYYKFSDVVINRYGTYNNDLCEEIESLLKEGVRFWYCNANSTKHYLTDTTRTTP